MEIRMICKNGVNSIPARVIFEEDSIYIACDYKNCPKWNPAKGCDEKRNGQYYLSLKKEV